MAHPTVTTDNLPDLLDDLVDRVPGAELAMVLSPDGLLLGASRNVGHELADQISSVAAGLQALALATCREYGSGNVRQIIVQMWRAFMFIATTRGGAILTIRFSGEADAGDIAYEVALFAGQAENNLPVYLEPAALHSTSG
ncbi:roadblock/LC7 domain-containing protein [Micromonospora sp. NPDC049559]|uniref:roadblock/LC7 domain-containing protein n=1 Tax=Micromonospora sp. NPDC049559 TaxID=3155923 RepID=UPI00342EF20B